MLKDAFIDMIGGVWGFVLSRKLLWKRLWDHHFLLSYTEMKLDLILGNFSSPSYIAHGASNSISWSFLALSMLVAGYLPWTTFKTTRENEGSGSKALSCRRHTPFTGQRRVTHMPPALGHEKLVAGGWARLNFWQQIDQLLLHTSSA